MCKDAQGAGAQHRPTAGWQLRMVCWPEHRCHGIKHLRKLVACQV